MQDKYDDLTSLVSSFGGRVRGRAAEKYEAGKQKVVDTAKDIDTRVHKNRGLMSRAPRWRAAAWRHSEQVTKGLDKVNTLVQMLIDWLKRTYLEPLIRSLKAQAADVYLEA